WYDLILDVVAVAVAVVKVEEIEEQISLPRPISWLGSHTKNVNAAVAGSG
nr:hypothetical protein [Tanacetum cinerariifolium]